MALDAFITLESLHCIREFDLPFFDGTEPYIWPVLIRIDDLTLQTDALVSVVAPLVGSARVIIKDSMRAGQTAPIPSSVGSLRTRLEDNLFDTHLILVVALWDGDETPEAALRAGFQAFVGALGAALGNAATLAEIQQAEANNDEAAKQAIAARIEEQVNQSVTSAIANALTGPQKVAVKTGFLDLDDILGSAFKGFSNALATPFTLTISKVSAFEIKGQLQIREVRVDRCQSQVNAVREAQSAVDGLNQQIKALQAELKRASPAEKPFIQQEIRQIREEDLPPAQAELGQALTALSICRSRLPPTGPGDAEQPRRTGGTGPVIGAGSA